MTKALFLIALSFCSANSAFSQSTFGTILGTVKDSSGAVVPNATVVATNIDENTMRETTTNSSGDYSLLNALPARYSITVTAKGFETFTITDLALAARQTLRVDGNLKVGQMSQVVTVESTSQGVIATDSQTIQASLDPQQMPVNVRANGNTSPYDVIQALPGVQADNGGNFSVQGGIPSQTQYSLDGISITNVTGNSPLSNAFPSTESIAEVRVQGVGNPAEYGQVGDITTVSKSGSNTFHGDLFWYTQNAALNATGFGSSMKNHFVANDFGASVGGPVVLPKIYHGKNKTFFFGTYEGFRLPKSSTLQDTVPTQAMRNGNFSGEGVAVHDLLNNPYANDTIPTSQINPVALKFLNLFPLPNSGDLSKVHQANYVVNRDNSYHSDQYDIRIDHNFGDKHHIFGRWTWKDITALSNNDLLIPSSTNPDNYRLLTLADNYSFTAAIYNEARFGFTRNDSGNTNSYNGAAFSQSLGLQGLPGLPAFFNGLPDVSFTNNLTGLSADRLQGLTKGRTYQAVDNLSWLKGRHTLKLGFDYRHIEAITPLGFLSGDNYGGFSFSGFATGSPFGDFLLGVPGSTDFDNVKMDNDGLTNHYNAYIQDSFRINDKLTLEYGLRWEFHPGYRDASGNIGNFDPSYKKSGAIIYPDGHANLLDPGLASTNPCPLGQKTGGVVVNGAPCEPVLSASQAGLPQSLRTAPNRFMPRFGFAYRPFGNKTVFRGGFSVYNTEVLGSIYYALTGTLQSATSTYNNVISAAGVPEIQWPNVAGSGSGTSVGANGTYYFGTANQINYKDPYSMQANFSIDRDLGHNTGLRASYVGMETRDLVWAPNLNQSNYSTTYYLAQPLSSRPFPNWGVVNTRANGADANYQAFELEVSHRYSLGLGFNSSYTFAKNLADNQGYPSSGFAGENAGGRTMDALDLKHEYGPVYASRKNRWLTSVVYELPVGKGRQLMAHSSRLADALIGGWQINSIFLWQSGPYMTPYFSGGDPSGTGSGFARNQAPDIIGNPNISNPTSGQWFNVAAFTCPGTPGWKPGDSCSIGTNPGTTLAPIGRFGSAGIGTVVGPGTVNVNAGLSKTFAVTERMRMKIEGSFTNAFNHTNYSDPVLNITSGSVGVITSARGSDFGGARTGQVGARIDF